MKYAPSVARSLLSDFCAGDEKHPCAYVRAEAHRSWATDGHRVLLLKVDNPETEIGDYFHSRPHIRVVDAVAPPPIDKVVPPNGRLAVTLNFHARENLDDLLSLLHGKTDVNVTFSRDPCVRLGIGRISGKNSTSWLLLQAEIEAPLAPEWPHEQLSVNARYLMQGIKALNPNRGGVSFDLFAEDPQSPIRIDSPLGTYVVMPVRA